ncbi:MAG: hypothetical protein DSZ23_06100 [Thermodesulfatator sp.]|nr:MAG: hypothetical protein DSZ23_06100 [Thermodesulfatator sp.]
MVFFQEIFDRIRGGLSSVQGGHEESIKAKFEQFKKVLRSNQVALEIIADMGEKLSGDYIFDKRYIEESYEKLSEAVLKSVNALNALCDNKYKDLYEVYDRVTRHLLEILKQREDRNGPPVIPLKAVTRSNNAIVGGKAKHLAKIIRDLELPVPDGFVITTRAYHDVIAYSGLAPKIDKLEGLIASPVIDSHEIEDLRREIQREISRLDPPPRLLDDIAGALEQMDFKDMDRPHLAVRSSAQEEDMDFSFAGQFDTVLNVRARPNDIFLAYRKVMASLFGKHVIEYRRTVLEGEGQMSIAALCQLMVNARSSGVLFTIDPLDSQSEDIVIVGNWGQGEAVVDGKMPTDTFRVSRKGGLKIVSRQVSRKKEALYLSAVGGLEKKNVPEELWDKPCLSDEEVIHLAGMGLRLENYFKRPQDVEWVVNLRDELLILQSRGLLLKEQDHIERSLLNLDEKYEIISKGEGLTAQQGIGCGPVKIVRTMKDLEDIPEGAVLVSPRDMSKFVQVMKKVSAIVTEVGTPVSHMATICRELGVPCLVNVKDILSKVHDGMIVTVDAEDQKIYKGKVKELLAYRNSRAMNVFESRDFRLLRRFLNAVAPLNLVDPLIEDFKMENCETYHDILRFIHEKAVQELIALGKDEKRLLKGNITRRLELSIPAGILCVDLGGGISEDAPQDHCELKHITSIPFRALLKGMTAPGVWHTQVMDVSLRDMVSSMINAPTDALDGQYSGHNIAIITREYVNLSLRFGYHFNIVDAYCSDFPRDNHIYFRFLGGATDLTKRSRRARLIAEILRAYDLNVKTKGDVVTARLGNMQRKDMEYILDILGRLIGFTRQLDVHMENDAQIDRYLQAFLNGQYDVSIR